MMFDNYFNLFVFVFFFPIFKVLYIESKYQICWVTSFKTSFLVRFFKDKNKCIFLIIYIENYHR